MPRRTRRLVTRSALEVHEERAVAAGRVALMRFNPNGSVDTSFDGDGIVRTDFGDYEAVEALAIQPDGKTVSVGGAQWGSAVIARYDPDGSPDPTFGSGTCKIVDGSPMAKAVLAGIAAMVVKRVMGQSRTA